MLGRRAARHRVSRHGFPRLARRIRRAPRGNQPVPQAFRLSMPSCARWNSATRPDPLHGRRRRDARGRGGMVLDCSGRAGIVARQGFRRADVAYRTLAIAAEWESGDWPARRIEPHDRRELRHWLGVVGAAVVHAPAVHRDDRPRHCQSRSSGRSARRCAPAGLHARARRGHRVAGAPRRRTSARAVHGERTRPSITRRRRATAAFFSSATPRRSSSRCRRPASRKR